MFNSKAVFPEKVSIREVDEIENFIKTLSNKSVHYIDALIREATEYRQNAIYTRGILTASQPEKAAFNQLKSKFVLEFSTSYLIKDGKVRDHYLNVRIPNPVDPYEDEISTATALEVDYD